MAEFRSYCDTHSEATTTTAATYRAEASCAICTQPMGEYDKLASIQTVCCQNWNHRKCMKEMAFTMHDDFACPHCENDNEFRYDILAKGIFIPNSEYISSATDINMNNLIVDEEPTRKKRRIHKEYFEERTFDSQKEATEAIESEGIWSYHYSNQSTAGKRVTYRCNQMKFRGKQCEAAVYLMYDAFSPRIGFFRSTSLHTHSDIANINNAVDKITGQLADKIKLMHELNVKPKMILYKLLQDGFKPPTKSKLYSFLSKLRKDKFGQCRIDFATLEKWLAENIEPPIEQNEPFIVDYFVSVNETNTEESTFRFLVSSKYLLQKAGDIVKLHADATYKLVWQGQPVLLVGTTDSDRHFHPLGIAVCSKEQKEDFAFIFHAMKSSVYNLFGIEMQPKVLISDAAASIHNAYKDVFEDDHIVMCWAHARRNIVKKIAAFVKDAEKKNSFLGEERILFRALK